MPASRRFLCDEMLGQLAKWLRILGYDTAYAQDAADDEIRARASSEDRVLLTRDVELSERTEGAVTVEELDPDDQLDEVVARLGLDIAEDRLLSRCTVCNVEVDRVDEADVQGKVPPGARAKERYWRCPRCARVYWEGTHVEEIRERVDGLREGSR